jgi:hypothetical protein
VNRDEASLCVKVGIDKVVCAGNEAAEVEEEALKSSGSREINDHESNDDVLMIPSNVLWTAGTCLQNVEWVKSKCVDVMWGTLHLHRRV